MERDFLGLSSTDSSHMVVKEKSKDICKNSVAEEQWPFLPKLSSPPKDMHSMFSPVSTGFLCDYNTKAPTSLAKKNAWTVPVVDRRISDSSSKLWVNKDVGSCSASLAAATTMKQQTIGGIYVPKPLSFSLPNAFNNRQTLLRSNAKTSTLPAELTIFYSGAVHVYHDITPQKAEAIMHMAGNGSSMTADAKQSSKPVDAENASATFVTGGITMARKATLTRFLEKRKSRLIDARPYNFTEKLLDFITPTSSKIINMRFPSA